MTTRRLARADDLIDAAPARARHVRARRASRIRVGFAAVATAVLLVGGITAGVSALSAPALSQGASRLSTGDDVVAEEAAQDTVPLPQSLEELPAPVLSAAPVVGDLCANHEFLAAIAAADDGTAIAVAGGAENLRSAISSGTAPCIPLSDPLHVWVLVNKTHPYASLEYSPASLAAPASRNTGGRILRADAAAAFSAMTAAAQAEGAGEIAIASGFRSYGMQQRTYGNVVRADGQAHADTISARPGHSEHQSGLAADVTACAGGCAAFEAFGGTPQHAWVVEHSWKHGWIIRYEEGYTAVTGYSPEPWHLRYVGVELATAYHEGGWHSLEEFLGAPPAPDYVG